MKKLYIIRHAKSSWKDLTLDDFDRPLNKRGRLNAPAMGKRLKKRKVMPDLILSSPALRAKVTAEVIASKVKYTQEIIYNKDIYDADIETIHQILTEIDDENGVVFLFGHNSNLDMLTKHYIKFDKNIPTCGVVEIDFKCDSWHDISRDNAKLVSFDYPKNIEEN